MLHSLSWFPPPHSNISIGNYRTNPTSSIRKRDLFSNYPIVYFNVYRKRYNLQLIFFLYTMNSRVMEKKKKESRLTLRFMEDPQNPSKANKVSQEDRYISNSFCFFPTRRGSIVKGSGSSVWHSRRMSLTFVYIDVLHASSIHFLVYKIKINSHRLMHQSIPYISIYWSSSWALNVSTPIHALVYRHVWTV